MGMTIDTAITVLGMVEAHGICIEAKDIAVETMRKYQKFQLDYEARLKADLVAMLTDMLIDVEEIASREQWCDYANDNCISRYDVEDLIQKKIKALKENIDGTNSD